MKNQVKKLGAMLVFATLGSPCGLSLADTITFTQNNGVQYICNPAGTTNPTNNCTAPTITCGVCDKTGTQLCHVVSCDGNITSYTNSCPIPPPPQQTCVPQCENRYAANTIYSGQCAQSGADFCGVNPVCTPNCLSRYGANTIYSGQCAQYGADICTSDPL